jgi:hypothetical protein
MADLADSWRAANAAATAAVKAIFGKTILAMAGKGRRPSDTEAQEVMRLQDFADELFVLATNRLGRNASSSNAAAFGPTQEATLCLRAVAVFPTSEADVTKLPV